MAHGGELARPAPAAAVSTELGVPGASPGLEVRGTTAGLSDSLLLGVAAAAARSDDSFRATHPGAVFVIDLGELTPQHRAGAARAQGLLDAAHGAPGAVHANADEFMRRPRPGAERAEELPGVVYIDLGEFVRQPRPSAGHAGLIRVGALRDPSPGAGFAGSGGALPDDLGTVHDNPRALRSLLPFAAMVASSAAVTGLADATASPAERFAFFALLLGGMLLVMVHVLRA